MKHSSRVRHLLQASFAFAVLVVVLYGQYLLIGSDEISTFISQVGYWGVLVFSFINGFNVFVPVVPTSFMPTLLESGLEFWMLIGVMSVGMSAADMVGFMVGRYIGGYHQVETLGVLNFLKEFQQENYYIPLLFAFLWGCFLPLPYELMMVPLGMMGYRFFTVAAISVSANFIFNCITALGFVEIFSYIFS